MDTRNFFSRAVNLIDSWRPAADCKTGASTMMEESSNQENEYIILDTPHPVRLKTQSSQYTIYIIKLSIRMCGVRMTICRLGRHDSKERYLKKTQNSC